MRTPARGRVRAQIGRPRRPHDLAALGEVRAWNAGHSASASSIGSATTLNVRGIFNRASPVTTSSPPRSASCGWGTLPARFLLSDAMARRSRRFGMTGHTPTSVVHRRDATGVTPRR